MNLKRVGVTAAVIGGIVVLSTLPSQSGLFSVERSSAILSGNGRTSSPLALTITSSAEFSGTGSASSPLSLAGALQGFDYGEFGDGSDGACNFTGGTVLGLTPTSNRYTLDRDIFCASMAVGASYSINAKAQIYVNGTLQLDGRIDRNGQGGVFNAGTPTDAGVTLANTNNNATTRQNVPLEFCGPQQCLTALGYPAAGVNACAPGTPSVALANGGNGQNGAFTGCGGGGGATCYQGGNTGGSSSGPSTNAAVTRGLWYLDNADGVIMWEPNVGYRAIVQLGSGGGIGSAGPHGNGGGQGLSGGWVVVHAREILGSGSIEAKGGNATTAAAPAANTCVPGGGGGGGGIVTVVINKGNFPTMSAAGGIGATGATCTTGPCTGLKGGNGGNGAAGLIKTFRVGVQ